MSSSPLELRDRFRAAVLGFAVGDALGFPLRGVPAASLGRVPHLAEDFAPRPRGRYAKGQFSDDTQLMLAAVESVVREQRVDGRSIAAHLAWLWEEGVILQPPAGLQEAAERLLRGVPWMSAGSPIGVREPSVLSRGLVAGLWNHDRPDRIAHDAEVFSVITHKDPLGTAAAAAFARAVALGLSGEEHSAASYCEQLALAAAPASADLAEELRHLPRVLTWEASRALQALRRIGVPAMELEGVDGLPAHVTPVLLTAVYASLKTPTDFREAVTFILRAGGESDVTAAMCGAIMGARLGSEAIPARLRKNVLYADHLLATADRLCSTREVTQGVVVSSARRR